MGEGNYKFFLLFLLYAFLDCLLVATTMDPGFNSLFNSELGSPQPSFVILIAYVFSIAVALALLGLGGFHAWLVYKGLTTLEVHGREEVSVAASCLLLHDAAERSCLPNATCC